MDKRKTLMSPKPYTLHYFNKITFSLSQDKVGIWLMFHVKLNDRYCLKPKGQSMLVKDSNYKPGIMTASSSKNCSSPIPPFCSLGIAQQIRSEMENGGRFTYQNSTIQIFLSMADLPPLQITLQCTLDGMRDRIRVGLFEDNGGLHRVWTG